MSPTPDELEIAPGFEKSNLQGAVFESPSDDELLSALDKAFDYRGDVTVRLKDGSAVEGYLFDRRIDPTLQDSVVRVLPKDGSGKRSISFAEISGLVFSGRDTAAGKSFDAWVRRYWEKKAAGEKNIELKPEGLE